jgi:hypothetical protein
MNVLGKLFYQIRYFGMEKTEKTRMELRHQSIKVDINGRKVAMKGFQYLDYLEGILSNITHNGLPVDIKAELAKRYYKYDLKGINVFINIIKKNARKADKKAKKLLKKSINERDK